LGTSLLRPAFPRVDGVLTCGGQALDDVAERFGTPLYLYDAQVIRDRYAALSAAFSGIEHWIAYSVKANGSLAILDLLARLGSGADIVSGGELARALRAGLPAQRIVFAGVGKTEREIEAALMAGIHAFNVESASELGLIESVAERTGRQAPIAIRVNPNVLSPTPHEYTRTGHATTKFGVSERDALELYRRAASSRTLDPRGIDVHIGSQISSVEPYVLALEHALSIVDILSNEGIRLDFLDLGGGFGVPDDEGQGLPVGELARAVAGPVSSRGLRLIIEPGRFLVGEAGVLVTRVLLVKRASTKTFVVTDGGMTELLRPSHYGGYHVIDPVRARANAPIEVVDVVGPICETGDFLALDRPLPMPEPGDLLAVRTSGAYGFVMASNYNARTRPAEVLVDGPHVDLIRTRETLDDLMRGERIPNEDRSCTTES
jgi:diaminopimelate decarboxylase